MISPMAYVYADMIKRGTITIDQVPKSLQKDVKKILEQEK